MIIRVEKNKNYSVICNTVLRDGRLSFRARGIAAYLLSQPDGWHINSINLARQGTEGRDAVRSAMKELEDMGYIQRVRRQGKDGQWSTDVVLIETPTTDSQASVSQASVSQAISTKYVSVSTNNNTSNNLLTPNGDSQASDEIDTHLLNGKISPSMELVPSSESPSKKVPQKKVSPPAPKNPAYQECFKVFNDLKQEHEGVPGKKVIINGSETGINIKKWLAAGYTAEELATVFVALKQDGWRTNALSMATIVKEGANILRRKTGVSRKGLGLTELQRWLQENYGVTDLETAAMIAEKTEQELLDDHAFYA